MLLAVDVGNTQTALGLYPDGELTDHWRLATERSTTADELGVLLAGLLDLEAVDGICLASTVPVLVREWELLASKWASAQLLVVGPGVKTGIPIRYDDPREVGDDVDAHGAEMIRGADPGEQEELCRADRPAAHDDAVGVGLPGRPLDTGAARALEQHAAYVRARDDLELLRPPRSALADRASSPGGAVACRARAGTSRRRPNRPRRSCAPTLDRAPVSRGSYHALGRSRTRHTLAAR